MEQTVKYRAEQFSMYEFSAIEEHLSSMAAEGWLLERVGLLWKYRKTEPKQCRFAVTYFPAASQFDPDTVNEPPVSDAFARRQEMIALADRDGWRLVSNNGQMQIFVNKNGENARPLETDAVTTVRNIHRTVKRAFLPSHILLLFVCLLGFLPTVTALGNDPLRLLSDPMMLCSPTMLPLLLASVLYELGYYFHWHRRAVRLAEETGELLPVRKNRFFSLFCAFASLGIFLMGCFSSRIGILSLLVTFGMMALVLVLTLNLRRLMKKWGFPRGLNMAISILLPVVVTYAFLFTSIHIIMDYGFTNTRQPAGTYTDFRGKTREYYNDPLPLTAEEITGEAGQWSRIAETKGTFLLKLGEYQDRPLMTGQNNALHIGYTVYEPAALLFDYTKATIMKEEEEILTLEVDDTDETVTFHNGYSPIDPAPWQAVEAYQLQLNGMDSHSYLLVYETRLVEFASYNNPPDEGMMKAVWEALGKGN